MKVTGVSGGAAPSRDKPAMTRSKTTALRPARANCEICIRRSFKSVSRFTAGDGCRAATIREWQRIRLVFEYELGGAYQPGYFAVVVRPEVHDD